MVVYRPAEYIYKGNNAKVSVESDAVITSSGVYWDKFNTEEFITWANPCDKNILWYDKANVGVKRSINQEIVPGRTLSLLGVWAYHWGQCMYQFLPKLVTAGEAGLLNHSITLLIDDNEDVTIMEIINNYLLNFPNVKIKFAKSKIDFICE